MKLVIFPSQEPPRQFVLAPGKTTVLGYAVNELDKVSFRLHGLPTPDVLTMRVGDALAECTPQFFPEQDHASPVSYYAVWPAYRYFELYAGRCFVAFEHAIEEPYSLAVIEVLVVPSKLSQESYNYLLADLQSRERGLLLDVYGKTFLTVDEHRPVPPQEIRPEEFLNSAQRAVHNLDRILGDIQRKPQEGYRTHMETESHQGRPLRPREISFLCDTPGSLIPTLPTDPERIEVNGLALAVNRSPVEHTIVNYDVYEHRAIKWFIQRLILALSKLRETALLEHANRLAVRSWKDYRTAGGLSWWEQEDLPRLQPLMDRATRCEHLTRRLTGLLERHSFLAKVGPFRPPLRSTPAFVRRPPYRRIFQLILDLRQVQGMIRFHGAGHQLRAQDIASLYEYWCTISVLDELVRRFQPLSVGPRQLFDTDQFVVSLRSGSEAWFHTGEGRLLRFRYEPTYSVRGTKKTGYGRLHGRQGWYLPDIALELFSQRADPIPEGILLFEVKYSRDPSGRPREKHLDTAWNYLQNIGRFDSRRSLVKHSWILYPGQGNEAPYIDSPEYFWSSGMESSDVSVGGISLVPGEPAANLTRVLDRIFELEGIRPSG